MTLNTHVRYFFVMSILFLAGGQHLQAQSGTNQPEWWFGGAVGANLNYYGGTVQALNSSTMSLAPMSKGAGTGLFLAPMLEYRPDPVWGGMLHLGFDSRGGSFDDVTSGASTASLSTSMNYLSLEPSLRISPFTSPVYFYAGPRVGFNIGKSFTYRETGASDVNGDWNGTRGAALGGQVGAGYDIAIGGFSASTPMKLSPFLAVHFGQGPRSEETWSLTTVRMGLALKFGSSAGSGSSHDDGGISFTVKSPKIIPTERRVRETFPVRNYVFFDEGSDAIPNRYVQLSKEGARGFDEKQLLEPVPQDLTGRSRRQLTTYYNVLNILGDRMRRFGSTSVTLAGSSEQGAANGKDIADAVKAYLVDAFGIDGQRIKTEGRVKPAIPSAQPGGSRELDLVRPEDRRVEFIGASAELAEPVQIVSLQEDPIDSDVLLTASGAENLLSSWSVDVTDEAGTTKRYGPFLGEQERISGRTILGDKLRGNYTIAMVGTTKDGGAVRAETTTRLVRSDVPELNQGLRFSIIFEFDQSKTVSTYERFLSGTVAPLIPEGASVIIHGHTDIVGEESHNLKLSRDRANETQAVLQRALAKAGKRQIKFDTYGFGEDNRRSPFENRLPEERFYNRTVIIDIVQE